MSTEDASKNKGTNCSTKFVSTLLTICFGVMLGWLTSYLMLRYNTEVFGEAVNQCDKTNAALQHTYLVGKDKCNEAYAVSLAYIEKMVDASSVAFNDLSAKVQSMM